MGRFSVFKSLSVAFLIFCVHISSATVFASVNPNDKTKESILFSAPSKGWEEISNTDEDIWYIDMKSVSRPSKNIVRIWSKRIPQKGSKSLSEIRGMLLEKGWKNSRGYTYSKAQFEIDCSKNMYRILAGGHFDGNGKEIETFNNPKADWQPIGSESVPSFIKEDICK